MKLSGNLDLWLSAVKAGALAAAPAEGLYGYVADPFKAQALENILAAKQRDARKGFIVLVGNVRQLDALCPPLPEAAKAAMHTCWRAGEVPTTLILPALSGLNPLLTGGGNTIAVRLPSVPYMQEYLNAWGAPLVSTSLNISGEAPALSASAIPAGVAALTLAEQLSGTPSRVFSPLDNRWLR